MKKNSITEKENNYINKKTEITYILDAEDTLYKINQYSVLEKGDVNIFIENNHTQLMITGNEGNSVQLEDILPEDAALTNWTHQTGNVTIAGVQYDVYSHNGSDAELLVQEGVKVELV